jgi:hypothetical protein
VGHGPLAEDHPGIVVLTWGQGGYFMLVLWHPCTVRIRPT